MDKATINYYSKNAQTVADRYESIVSSLAMSFDLAFKPKSKILDVGCGSGRDLALLSCNGHECYGVDATPEFVNLSQTFHPELKDKVLHACLPNFEPPFGGDFDGVLCSAVLMHIPESELLQAAVSIKRCLKLRGRLLYSIPSKRLDLVTENRDAHGRLFVSDYSDQLQIIFNQLGFTLISKWDNSDSLGRDEVEWISILMELSDA